MVASLIGLQVSSAQAAGPTPTFSVQAAGPTVTGLQTPGDLARVLLGTGVSLAPGDRSALVNLQTSSELPSQMAGCRIEGGSDRDPCSPLPAFGRFSNGSGDLGIPDGLIITANAGAVAGFSNSSSLLANIALQRASGGSFADANALSALTAAAGLSPSVFSATSLTFELAPPPPGEGRYLKFEYSLLITEGGIWSQASGWAGSSAFRFPDGFALFTGGTAVTDNCAVVPQTDTYLSMSTAGIVDPQTTFSAGRADAQARLDARIADPDDPPTTPNGFAYPTGELVGTSYSPNSGWRVRFLTVPLTCVYDAEAEIAAGDPIPVQVVVGNLGDAEVPPAVALKGSSIRWSNNPTPGEDVRLEVTRSGTGSGTVTSTPAGINCGATCEAGFGLGSAVTLTATADSGSTFTGWSGSGCSGTGTCEVAMSEARLVTATFDLASPSGKPKLKLSVKTPKKAKAGKGFGVQITTRNVATSASTRQARVNGDSSPTTAKQVKTCAKLPKGLFVVKRGGGKVKGQTICWSRSSLAAGESVTYKATVRSSKSSSGSIKVSGTASATNDSGVTVKASGSDRTRIVKPRSPKPEPPTG